MKASFAVAVVLVLCTLAATACKKSGRDSEGYRVGVDSTGRTREPFIPATGHAKAGPLLKTAKKHPMQYWISVPRGWPGKRAWPVVLTITGSGKDFWDNADLYARFRNERFDPFILVSPVLLTNGGDGPVNRAHKKYNYPSETWDRIEKDGRCKFDLDGIRAVIEEVHELYAGESKAMLTGWSGGGHPGWATVLLQPDKLRAAALVGANYQGRCVTDEAMSPFQFSTAPDRVQLPVRIFNGADDPYVKMSASEDSTILALTAQHGFANVTQEVVPGRKHEPMPPNVLTWFLSLLPVGDR